MRVIQVTDYGSPYSGSFVPMLEAALRVTSQRGWTALAVLPSRARRREWLPAFEAEHASELVFAPDDGHLGLTRWLGRLVDSAPGPTLLHAHWSVFDLPVAVLAWRRADVRAVWHFHTVLSDSLRARMRNRLRFMIAGRFVDHMLCVAPHLVEAICGRGAPAEKVVYLPNAVDATRFSGVASAEERAAARASLGLDPCATVLLHIGRDWHLKGGDLFLDTFERLGDDHLVGLMVRGGDVARREVQRRALAGRVFVLEGTSDMRRLHAASDLMLATSRGEGMPFAVVEALSSGLAVVGTDIPGHALPGRTPPGLRIAALEPGSLAEEVRRLLERDAERARHESALSHAWVRESVSLEAWATRLLTIYESVAATWAEAGRRG